MKINALVIENFGPIEAARLHLGGRGLVNIEGINNDDTSADSNGSGKSTIPDALYWCLFGETAREVSGDDVINRKTGKNCRVDVTIHEGDDIYIVKRWRKFKGMGKASGVSLQKINASSGETTDLTQGTDKLTQAKIESVLGCSKEVFTKAVYSGQEALPDLPKMTDKQIKTLVEEAAGIELLTRAYELARENLRDANAKQAEATRDLQEAERIHNERADNFARLTAQQANWRGEQDARIATKHLELRTQVEKAKALVKEQAAIDLPTLEAKRAALRASVDAVSSEQDRLRDLAKAVSTARSSAAAERAKLEAKLIEVKRATTHLGAIDGKVGTPCSECGKAYAAEDLGTARKLAQEKLAGLVEEGKRLKTAVEFCEQGIKDQEKEHDRFKATMTDVTAALAELDVIDKQIARHNFLGVQADNATVTARRIKVEHDGLVAQNNPFDAAVTPAEEKKNAAFVDLARRNKSFQEAEHAVKIANGAVATFGPSGVRAYVLDTVTPYLNERTSHYLGTLSDGRIQAIWTTLATNAKGELVEKFCIEVEKAGGGASFKALSGGEKRKVRLACALALQDLVASRASKPIELWIGDEIDDALDEAGLERLMAVLEEKAREKGTVLVISHNSLSDFIRETVTVTMSGGTSTVTGGLVA